ncbi:class I SAM-dependent methyltransferase [Hamadaea tsunoensis]|uniref:class I SAM-dependent methyltransferase n=1 Tax=Hamadaea tsunoensis TaxID=53368 RepID=UPI00040EE652|nr:class I SAM-dependent methyltransferase [Hamadaea tsunoensis]
MSSPGTKRLPVPTMEGATARWYARNRGSAPQRAAYRTQAAAFARRIPEGAEILEIAPGPGYFAVELAHLGFPVTGLDISTSFVRIASAYARSEGVAVDFRHGDAAALPFPDRAFDVVVCQAAFKNFQEPVRALDEMHRVLRPGGTAYIHDMNHDITAADIAAEVAPMGLSTRDAWFTRIALRGLRRRAFTADRFRGLAQASRFGSCEVDAEGIGLEVRLRRP